jgi:hypothetical protein
MSREIGFFLQQHEEGTCQLVHHQGINEITDKGN